MQMEATAAAKVENAKQKLLDLGLKAETMSTITSMALIDAASLSETALGKVALSTASQRRASVSSKPNSVVFQGWRSSLRPHEKERRHI